MNNCNTCHGKGVDYDSLIDDDPSDNRTIYKCPECLREFRFGGANSQKRDDEGAGEKYLSIDPDALEELKSCEVIEASSEEVEAAFKEADEKFKPTMDRLRNK